VVLARNLGSLFALVRKGERKVDLHVVTSRDGTEKEEAENEKSSETVSVSILSSTCKRGGILTSGSGGGDQHGC
jgi:hypothetical protein